MFFAVVAKSLRRSARVDVLGFMTAQRTGGEGRLQVAGDGGDGVPLAYLIRRPALPGVTAGLGRRRCCLA